jgi:ribosomal-protein-serine acetyltransferase
MNYQNYSIRLITKEDAPLLFTLIQRNTKRLESFFAGLIAKTKTIAETTVFVTEKIEQPDYMLYVLVDNSTNALIGYLGVMRIDWSLPKGEFSYFIDETYSGKGLSRHFLMMVINKLFTQHAFAKLYLRTHASNTAARALAEQCGFELEGTIRKDYKTTQGELVDLMYYGLVQNE